MAFTLPTEGGFVDNPDDDGGATDHGITQHVYDRYRALKGLPLQSVASIGTVEVDDIYEKWYWLPSHAGELGVAIGVCHFDWSVNHGVKGAIVTLQQTLGFGKSDRDGIFGPATRTALEAWDERKLVTAYTTARADWYHAFVMVRPEETQFLDGWLARDFKLQSYALSLLTP